MGVVRPGILAATAAFCLAGAVPGDGRAAGGPNPCVPVGTWVSTGTGEVVTHQDLISRVATDGIVLLGEFHDRPEHHRWQLSVVAGLYAVRKDLVLGFEVFPRRVQPVLDRWQAGELDEKAFLEAVEWNRIWAVDPRLYLPLFHFARMNRIPLLALNVDPGLVERVRDEGWDQVPESDREGVSDPAPPSDRYLETLERIYRSHLDRGDLAGPGSDQQGFDDDAFQRFTAAQLLRDRAMAEAIDAARRRPDQPLVVAVIGGGHVEGRVGVPRQLAEIGYDDSIVLIPWDQQRDCAALTPDTADAVFGIDPPAEPASPRPRLGVRIRGGEDGVVVVRVSEGSVAEAAQLREKDVIMRAADTAVTRVQQLIAIVQRQPPGTWLPLTVRRDDEILDIIAKFPGRQ